MCLDHNNKITTIITLIKETVKFFWRRYVLLTYYQKHATDRQVLQMG